jgi:AraC-like DNA-binding protein
MTLLAALADRMAIMPDRILPGLLALVRGRGNITSIKALARHADVAPRSIHRWCSAASLSAGALVQASRIAQMHDELSGGLSAAAVAQQIGYSSVGALRRSIRAVTGLNMMAFRRAGSGVIGAIASAHAMHQANNGTGVRYCIAMSDYESGMNMRAE